MMAMHSRARFRGDDQYVGRHDLPYQRLLRILALQGDLAGVVALRNDADQFAFFHHHQRADAFFGEHLDRFEHGVIGLHAPECVAVAGTIVEQFGDGFHDAPR